MKHNKNLIVSGLEKSNGSCKAGRVPCCCVRELIAPISGVLGKPCWHSLPAGTASLGSVFGLKRIRYKLWSSECHTGAHGVDRLRTLGLFSLETRRVCGKLTAPSRTWRGLQGTREILSIRSWSDRPRNNGFELKEGKFRWEIRKKFFTNWAW